MDEKIYGCHCDLEPGMVPDGCMIDAGKSEDCIYAHGPARVLFKEHCKYWRVIDGEKEKEIRRIAERNKAILKVVDETMIKECANCSVSSDCRLGDEYGDCPLAPIRKVVKGET